MKKVYELIRFDDSIPVKCSLNRIIQAEQHWHDSLELLMVLSGEATVVKDADALELIEGDVLVINARQIHELSGINCVIISLQIDTTRLANGIDLPRIDCCSAGEAAPSRFDAVRQLIAKLVQVCAEHEKRQLSHAWSLLYKLIHLLSTQFASQECHSESQKKHLERISSITAIIGEQYAQNLSLSSLAEQVHLSPTYLSRYFEQHFGVTFLAYLTQVRLTHAVSLLLTSNETIEQVAAASGFANTHAFVQAFKRRYEMLPSLFRRNNRQSQDRSIREYTPGFFEVEHSHYLSALSKYLDLPVQAQEKSVATHRSLSLSMTQPVTTLRHTWKQFVCLSRANELLMEDIRVLLRELQQRIGYQYIKFHGLLSDEMRVCQRDKNGKIVYSFAMIDNAFDFLLSIGLRPLVQLSFMPSVLAKNPSRQVLNFCVSEPRDLQEWLALIRAVTMHLIERYGLAEVERWLFCVWNEPDTSTSIFGFQNNAEFYSFYRETYPRSRDCQRRWLARRP